MFAFVIFSFLALCGGLCVAAWLIEKTINVFRPMKRGRY